MRKVEPTPEERTGFAADCRDYRLAWKCCDCVHFAENTGRCSLEYPTSELMEAPSFDTVHGTFVFCKHFELI